MVLSWVRMYTDIPFLRTKAEERTSLRNLGCWDTQKRMRGWGWAADFCFSILVSARHSTVGERARLAVEKCIWLKHRYQSVSKGWTWTLKLRKSEKRAEGICKEEGVRLAPFEKKSLGYQSM